MSKHICQDTKKLIKVLVKQGFRVRDKGQQMLVYAPDGESMFTVHMSNRGRSYHPLRRWALNLGYNIK